MQTPSNLPSVSLRSGRAEGAMALGQTVQRPREVLQQRLRYQQAVQPRRSVAAIARIAAEPDDATITGATRSLSRRLLALNIRKDS